MVEDKNISLVYHHSNVPKDVRKKVLAEITALVIRYGYIPVPSHGAIEIKPPVVWSKGHAAILILNEIYGKGWEENVHVIYMGDDTSDEDPMKVSFFSQKIFVTMLCVECLLMNLYSGKLQMLKGKGTTFRITSKPDFKSSATFKIQSVTTATFILEWLVNNTDF